ncbi:MAG: hypothetical protein KJN79_00140 [Gammaproteobacteria bacterium]|nr:hypothetical protein [Gammaproteobacteria bacterium]
MKAIRKPQWYRMTRFFDGDAQMVTEVGDAEVLLQGTIYETTVTCQCGNKIHLDRIKLREDGRADLSPQLGMCLIPQEAVSNSQGDALRRMLEANLRQPVVLISNNVQLVQLKPIHQAEADRILSGGDPDDGQAAEGSVVAFSQPDGQGEQGGGEDIRAADSDGPADDNGPAASDGPTAKE